MWEPCGVQDAMVAAVQGDEEMAGTVAEARALLKQASMKLPPAIVLHKQLSVKPGAVAEIRVNARVE